MLGPGDRDDDIALLAARFDGIAPSDVAYWFLEPAGRRPPGRARRLARRALPRWGLEDLMRLGGAAGQRGRHQRRAVRRPAGHAAAAAHRRAALRGRRRRPAAAPACARPGPATRAAAGCTWSTGWPSRWGATRLSTGKVVWFEQSLSGEGGEAGAGLHGATGADLPD